MRWLLSSTVGYVIGLLYPAYATFKAIKQAEAHRLADPAWSQETASNVSSSSSGFLLLDTWTIRMRRANKYSSQQRFSLHSAAPRPL